MANIYDLLGGSDEATPTTTSSGTFLGQSGNQWAQILGGLAQAIAPDTMGARLGAFGAQMGAQQQAKQEEKDKALQIAKLADALTGEGVRTTGVKLQPDGSIGVSGVLSPANLEQQAQQPEQPAAQQPAAKPTSETPKIDFAGLAAGGLSADAILNVMQMAQKQKALAAEELRAERAATLQEKQFGLQEKQFGLQEKKAQREETEFAKFDAAMEKLKAGGYTPQTIQNAPADVLAAIQPSSVSSMLNIAASLQKGTAVKESPQKRLMGEIFAQQEELGMETWQETPLAQMTVMRKGSKKDGGLSAAETARMRLNIRKQLEAPTNLINTYGAAKKPFGQLGTKEQSAIVEEKLQEALGPVGAQQTTGDIEEPRPMTDDDFMSAIMQEYEAQQK